MILVLPIILGIAGAIGLGALGAYGGVKLGHFLMETLNSQEKEYLRRVFERFGIDEISDIDKLSTQQKEELFSLIDQEVKEKLPGEQMKMYEDLKKKVLG